MGEAEQDRRTAEVIAGVSETVAAVRREADRRRAEGQDTAWLDEVLARLVPVVEQAHDLEITHAVRRVVERHGPGPYPVSDLAALAGIDDLDALQRVLDRQAAEGLASSEHPDAPPGSPH